MVKEKPPYDASVENIQTLCTELRDATEESADDLEESVEGLQGTTFMQNLKAAVELGFFEENDGLYQPTTKGKRIGYGLDSAQQRELFREVINDYEFYHELLGIVGDELEENNGEQYLSRDEVQRAIGINFEFSVSDRTLESAAGTFLKLLDAAGVGEYKQGRKGHPTRLVVNDQYSGFLANLNAEEQGGGGDVSDDNNSEGNADVDEVVEGNAGQEPDAVEEQEKVRTEQMYHSAGDGTDVEINIEISSADWTSDEVIEFVESLQEE